MLPLVLLSLTPLVQVNSQVFVGSSVNNSFPQPYPGIPNSGYVYNSSNQKQWQEYYRVNTASLPNATQCTMPSSFSGSVPVNRPGIQNDTLFFWALENSPGSLTDDSSNRWVGTGFSTASLDGYIADQDQTGQDFMGFLTNLVMIFSSLKTRPLYLLGESYAGMYIPYITKAYFRMENPPVNLKHLAITDGNMISDIAFEDATMVSVVETYPQLIGYDIDVYKYFKEQSHLCGYDLNITFPQTTPFPKALRPEFLDPTVGNDIILSTSIKRGDLRNKNRDILGKIVKARDSLPPDTFLKRDNAQERRRRFQVEVNALKRDLSGRANGTIDPQYECSLFTEVLDYALNFSQPWVHHDLDGFDSNYLPDALFPKAPQDASFFLNDKQTVTEIHAPQTAIQNTTFGNIQGFTRPPGTAWYGADGQIAGIVHQERNVSFLLFKGAGKLLAQSQPDHFQTAIREFVLGNNLNGSMDTSGSFNIPAENDPIFTGSETTMGSTIWPSATIASWDSAIASFISPTTTPGTPTPKNNGFTPTVSYYFISVFVILTSNTPLDPSQRRNVSTLNILLVTFSLQLEIKVFNLQQKMYEVRRYVLSQQSLTRTRRCIALPLAIIIKNPYYQHMMETENKLDDLQADVGDEFFGTTQTEVQITSNIVELSSDIEQKTILADQKMMMNALVTINKLPVELFTYIILLTRTSLKEAQHPYLLYTWVCRHWRSVIVQTSAFWTLIRGYAPDVGSFDHELLRRSGSAKVDIILSNYSSLYGPIFQNFLSKESNRVRNLGVYTGRFDLNHLVPSQVQFPSLRGFVFRRGGYNISQLLSVLVASEHLEMLELELREDTGTPSPMDQLDLVFNRIRNLRLTICSDTIIPTAHAFLRSSIKVQKLQIKNLDTLTLKHPISSSDQTILPELQLLSVMDPFLLDYLQAPKLSSLDVGWLFMSNPALNYKIIEEFDFSLIKHMYIRGPRTSGADDGHGYCILASKKPVNCYSITPNFLFEDTLSHDSSRDWFHLGFSRENTFAEALREIMLLILPRSTSLIELHLLYRIKESNPHTVPDFRVNLPMLKSLSLCDLPSLLENLRLPKLSSLNINWQSAITLDCPFFAEFDFSSIKYLYIRGPQSLQKVETYCILGSKERISCNAFHSVMDVAPLEDHTNSNPTDSFHLVFKSEKTFVRRLSEITSLILPRLTSLAELYLLFSHTLIDFREIVTQTPSVKKVVVQRGRKLINFLHLLNKPSLCPRLKYLSFTTFLVPGDLEKYAKHVGKTLTSCLRSRLKDSSTQEHLKYIVLKNCPPLPNNWLNALRKIGTDVITERDVKVSFSVLPFVIIAFRRT
ncbi:hypothetical protein Clacol_004512 [Clathrus columnatus]|uniref:Carboxypeptidase n=1 Tax=Clathrus columnatus TaxID=1419009 RepID=A0AAV5AB83_9AGAM|nr:hypothetical protein Clacol_004512 [Clathrus columnatus]